MGFSINDQLPIPPIDAEVKNIICEFCIVGCGYKAYKWPKGSEGSHKRNAFGIDLSQPQPALVGTWASPQMFNTVKGKDNKEYNVMVIPDKDCVVNQGQNSVRGGAMAATLYNTGGVTDDRLTTPLIYGGQNMNETSWDNSINLVAKVVKKVMDRDGSDQVAVKMFDHGGGGGGFENTWGTGKLFFTAIGTTSAAIHNRPAYNSETFATREMGIYELNTSYYDVELADTMFIIGGNPYGNQSNLFILHMMKNLSGESMDNKKKEYDSGETVQSGKIIIVDPRISTTVTNSRKAAGDNNVLHLQIKPGTDVTLMNALLTYIREKNWDATHFINHHTEKYEEVIRANKTSLDKAVKITGLAKSDIIKCAEWIAKPKASGHRPRNAIFYEKGIIWGIKNYPNVGSIVNVALATSSVGRVGTGVCRLGGHQEGYTRPPYKGPERQHLKVIDEDILKGEYMVSFLWACNPFICSVEAEKLREGYAARAAIVKKAIDANVGADTNTIAEAIYDAIKNKGGMFFVTMDIYPTLKDEIVHIIFPAATTMEMNLTSMNGERRLRLSQRIVDRVGESKPDCLIAADIANAIRKEYLKEGNSKMAARFDGFDWTTEEDAFKDGFAGQGAKLDSEGGPTGVLASYELLIKAGNNGVQLPIKKVIDDKFIGTRRLYTNFKFKTKSGRAIFHKTPQPSVPEPVQRQIDKYDFWINSGRVDEMWQSNFHTSRLVNTKTRWGFAPLFVNPKDAKKIDIQNGDLVLLYNDYGSTRAVTYISEAVREKEPYMAFGFPNSIMNNLVTEWVDPATKIPYYKGTAANIRRIGKSKNLLSKMTFKAII